MSVEMSGEEYEKVRLFARGKGCELWGRKVWEMERWELIVFIGYLDELIETERKNASSYSKKDEGVDRDLPELQGGGDERGDA